MLKVDVSDSEQIIQRFENFFNTFYDKELLDAVKDNVQHITVDFRRLDEFSPELGDELLERPRDIIECAREAIKRLDLGEDFVEIEVRFRHIPDSYHIPLWKVRDKHMDKLLAFKVFLRQALDVRTEILEATFDCPNCGNLIIIPQSGPELSEPSHCICGRKGKFRRTDQKMTSVQFIVIEDPLDASKRPTPVRMNAFLRGSLTEPEFSERIVPGAEVLVTGILGGHLPSGRQKGRVLDHFIDVVDIEPTASAPDQMVDSMTKEELEQIEEIAKRPDIYELWRDSMAPTIHGHTAVKDALPLFLIGGVRKIRDDGTTTRGSVHVLLIGDPGCGKSMILNSTDHIAPKSVRAVGGSSSGVGLTAAAVKNEFLKEWVLEAGSLVRADGGIACIDEFDKADEEDRNKLHEAMEQQTVTVDKVNIHATLQSRTGILAAANPKRGRFDPYQPIISQFDLPPPLISRFDLIFPIKDKPDRERDAKLADHVLGMHGDKLVPKSPIPAELIPLYIAHAQTINPQLTDAAIKTIKAFFLAARDAGKDPSGAQPIGITTRQLESMVRLTEASARLRLSKIATKADAQRAVRVMLSYLKEVGVDPRTGKFDMDRIIGTPHWMRNHCDQVLAQLSELEGTLGAVPMNLLISSLDGRMNPEEVATAVERLVDEGEVAVPHVGFYRRVER